MISRFEEHFEDEEQMMEEHNFKGLVYHKYTHDALLTKIRVFNAPMKTENIDFVKEW